MMASGEAVVGEARRWIGTPYRHQGSRCGAGCDCLGLIRGVWRALHGAEAQAVPAYSADWRDGGAGDALEAAAVRHLHPVAGDPEAGDVLLFRLMRHRPARHCGILIAPGRFIHAQEHLGVVEMALSDAWARRVAGVFRFP